MRPMAIIVDLDNIDKIDEIDETDVVNKFNKLDEVLKRDYWTRST